MNQENINEIDKPQAGLVKETKDTTKYIRNDRAYLK